MGRFANAPWLKAAAWTVAALIAAFNVYYLVWQAAR